MAAPLLPAGARRLAIAVSGGPDSMALALLAKASHGDRSLRAFIVDHKLREESSTEAAAVAARLAALGIDAEILVWNHDVVKSRIHVKARQARYALLLEACRRWRADALLLAHHADDQAETITMRLAKGSGIDGLAGMAAATALEGMPIIRPFLNLPKARLTATCAAAAVQHVSDPSNAAEKYARGRLRKIMPFLAAEGLTRERILDLGVRAREAGEALDYYTDALLRDFAEMDEFGAIRINRAELRKSPMAVALRATDACLRAIHDGGYPTERASLLPLVEAARQDNAFLPARTLNGCEISASADRVEFRREPAAAAAALPMSISAGQTVIWDERWAVSLPMGFSAPEADGQMEIRALGTHPHAALDAAAPWLRKLAPKGRVRASLPALWSGGELKAVPAPPSFGTACIPIMKVLKKERIDNDD